MDTDRKTLIADAAIALLGAAGARGLTHRAVDARAGLAEGSTSFYCRTKLDLWRLALVRHAELDLADLAADEQRMHGKDWTRDSLVDLLVHRVEDWSSDAKRERSVARFELFLVASREPELARIIDGWRLQFLQLTVEGVRRAGMADARTLGPLVVVALEGLLLDRLRASAGVGDAFAPRRLLQRLLGG